MTFRVPVLPKLRPSECSSNDQPYKLLTSGLPVSSLDEISVISCIGRGAFGEVSVCRRGSKKLVLKELIDRDVNSQRLFAKEAKLIHGIHHDNIVKFNSVCYGHGNNPNVCAFLMEFSQFDFNPFGYDYSVSSLGDFLTNVDRFNCEGFEHLGLHIVTDVCKGLNHLHEHNIAHRDLKPGNILVSNLHYATLNEKERNKFWVSRPIIAKLTDFGESRAALVQTNSIAHAETSNVRRGSPAYMAPEIYTYDGCTKMDIAGLISTDMWSYAMVVFMVLNPNMKWPYQIELEREKKSGNPKPYKDILNDLFRKCVLPSHGNKYQSIREKDWQEITETYNMCAKFNQRPSSDEVLRFLTRLVRNKEEVVSPSTEHNHSGSKRKFDAVSVTSDDDDRENANFTATNVSEEVIEQYPVDVVQGLFHQASSDIFTHDAIGTQCSSISLMAVIFAHLKPHKDWMGTDINDILLQGDREHLKALRSLGWPTDRSEGKLDIDELPSVVTVYLNEREHKASVGVLNNSIYCLSHDFKDTMQTILQKNPGQHFILRMFDKCTAVLCSRSTGKCSIFDPHSMDANGDQVAGGTACLMHFDSSTDMISYIENNLKGKPTVQLDITPVDVGFLYDRLCTDPSSVPETEGFHEVIVEISDGSGSESEEPVLQQPMDPPRNSPTGCTDNESTACGTDNEVVFGDQRLPVYIRGKRERFTPTEAVNILHQYTRETEKCTTVPLGVRENCAFIVDVSRLSSADDLKADMNGIYQRLLRVGTWTVEINNKHEIRILHKRKSEIPQNVTHQFHLCMNSKANYAGLSRSIFILRDGEGNIVNNLALLQYNVEQSNEDGKLEFDVLPHGNRRNGSSPFFPTQRSTLSNIKSAVRDGESSSSIYNKMSNSEGGVMGVRNPSQLPRSRHQIYGIKGNIDNMYDDIEELLLYAQTKDDGIVLDHQDLPEDMWVLGTEQMCLDMSRLCCGTDKPNCYPISIDPTFEFGQFEVTPITYRHPFLISKRSGVSPVLLGPTALHHSKDSATFSRMISSVTRSCPQLKSALKGFVTDGEAALHSAMQDGFPNATGLRCFRHFESNCKKKLNDIGIRSKQDQKFYIQFVFGRNGRGGIVDSIDATALEAAIRDGKNKLDEHERNLLGGDEKYESKFWKYVKRSEGMIANHMIISQRRKAGMPLDQYETPYRAYTNQSESINNILTRQKEAVCKAPKRLSSTNKLSFVKNVWEEVVKHQTGEIGRALCGMSEEFCLAEDVSYLEIKPDTWFSWSRVQREQYLKGFNTLTVNDVLARKSIQIPKQPKQSSRQNFFALEPDIKGKLQDLVNVSDDVADSIISETNYLLQSPSAVKEMPSLEHNSQRKYMIASKACKRGFYICTIYNDHVSCDCPAYKYQMVCKHNLCLAIQNEMLDFHFSYVSRRKPKKQRGNLMKPTKDAAGKKGGKHRNQWRQRQPYEADGVIPDRPFREIHHNNLPFHVCFLADEMKAKECYQCGVEFPRIQKIRPFDIVISHREKWSYTTKEEPHQRRISTKFTTWFYCVQASCIIRRFHYFTSSLLEVGEEQKNRLTPSHKELLKRELNVDIP